jgi:peptide deformylase
MILPVTVYGDPILRKVTPDIDNDYQGLDELVSNMFETMYNADGVGLAAPQIGRSVRLFIVDATPIGEEDETLKDFKKIFINPHITEKSGDEEDMEEGCLSIPGIREEVKRKNKIRIKYFDQGWVEHDEVYEGFVARILQHEYDHLDGILFVDYCSPLKKRLLKAKLTGITKGKADVKYRIKIPRR